MFICTITVSNILIMKKITAIIMLLTLYSCGWLIDTTEEEFLYTFIVKNETGLKLEIIGNDLREKEIIEHEDFFECSYVGTKSSAGALCTGFFQVKIYNTNMGYRCHGFRTEIENLCFVKDDLLFTRLEGNTVFTKTSKNVYQYTLTPDILEGVYELPELDF